MVKISIRKSRSDMLSHFVGLKSQPHLPCHSAYYALPTQNGTEVPAPDGVACVDRKIRGFAPAGWLRCYNIECIFREICKDEYHQKAANGT